MWRTGVNKGGYEPAASAIDQRPTIIVRPKGPFDLRLSLEAAASFFPRTGLPPATLRMPIELEERAAIIEVWQLPRGSRVIHASSTPALERDRLRSIVKRLISADLDLRRFYAIAAPHSVMGPVVRSLPGLKPIRPATLFEMAVIAITEQQLSLAAAFHIRARLLRRFGRPLDDLRIFPSPERLAAATLEDLCGCGLSRRKSDYLKSLAEMTASGDLDLESLDRKSDRQIRETLAAIRGFGQWSVQYTMGRGLGRPDSLPSADTGLRRVVGDYLAGGRRVTATELEEALAPFRPFRGLAAFYLAVHWRLRRKAASRPEEPHPLADADCVAHSVIGGVPTRPR